MDLEAPNIDTLEDGICIPRIKRSTACSVCKRRKGRCEGGVPCRWCAAHNLECTVTSDQNAKKRKRDGNERAVVRVNTRELGLLSAAEIAHYVDLYLTYFPIAMDLANGGSIVKHLQNPKSYSEYFVKYAMCAISARACGSTIRALNIVNEARSFARQSYDDMSVDSLAGFALLSVYYMGSDISVSKHYASIGTAIYASIPHMDIPSTLGYVAVAYSAVYSSRLPLKERVKAFLAMAKEYPIHNAPAAFLTSHVRLMSLLFSETKSMQFTTCRVEVLVLLLFQLSFTEEQRSTIFVEVNKTRNLGVQLANRLPYFSLDFVEIFVNIQSGHTTEALSRALTVASEYSIETFKFATRFEVEQLIALALLMHPYNPPVAQKFYSFAVYVHSLVCDPAPFPESAKHISSFILAHHHHHNVDSAERMTNGLISLACRFLPLDNPKALLPLDGLHTVHVTLARALPPTSSQFDSFSVDTQHDLSPSPLPSPCVSPFSSPSPLSYSSPSPSPSSSPSPHSPHSSQSQSPSPFPSSSPSPPTPFISFSTSFISPPSAPQYAALSSSYQSSLLYQVPSNTPILYSPYQPNDQGLCLTDIHACTPDTCTPPHHLSSPPSPPQIDIITPGAFSSSLPIHTTPNYIPGHASSIFIHTPTLPHTTHELYLVQPNSNNNDNINNYININTCNDIRNYANININHNNINNNNSHIHNTHDVTNLDIFGNNCNINNTNNTNIGTLNNTGNNTDNNTGNYTGNTINNLHPGNTNTDTCCNNYANETDNYINNGSDNYLTNNYLTIDSYIDVNNININTNNNDNKNYSNNNNNNNNNISNINDYASVYYGVNVACANETSLNNNWDWIEELAAFPPLTP